MGRRRGQVLMRPLTELEISMAEPYALIRFAPSGTIIAAQGFLTASFQSKEGS